MIEQTEVHLMCGSAEMHQVQAGRVSLKAQVVVRLCGFEVLFYDATECH